METAVGTKVIAPAAGAVVVQVLNGAVLRDGRPVELSPMERLLAVALAVQPVPVPAAELGEILYPDRDGGPDRLRNVVKVYVYRLRRRVSADFVVCAGGGYCLGSGVRTDVAEFGPLIGEVLRRIDQLSADDRERIERIARALRAERPPAMLNHDWYAAVCRRFARQGHDVTCELAKNALARGDDAAAMRLAYELIDEDASDETARELVIRAHLRAGRHGAAVQEFRRYSTVLAAELGVSPSPHLAQLLRPVSLPTGAVA